MLTATGQHAIAKAPAGSPQGSSTNTGAVKQGRTNTRTSARTNPPSNNDAPSQSTSKPDAKTPTKPAPKTATKTDTQNGPHSDPQSGPQNGPQNDSTPNSRSEPTPATTLEVRVAHQTLPETSGQPAPDTGISQPQAGNHALGHTIAEAGHTPGPEHDLFDDWSPELAHQQYHQEQTQLQTQGQHQGEQPFQPQVQQPFLLQVQQQLQPHYPPTYPRVPQPSVQGLPQSYSPELLALFEGILHQHQQRTGGQSGALLKGGASYPMVGNPAPGYPPGAIATPGMINAFNMPTYTFLARKDVLDEKHFTRYDRVLAILMLSRGKTPPNKRRCSKVTSAKKPTIIQTRIIPGVFCGSCSYCR
ncbi:hypothetical protein KCU73_g8456, partial [Aureobasidium melanogenum]